MKLASIYDVQPGQGYLAEDFAHLFRRSPGTIVTHWRKKLPPIPGHRPYLYRGSDILALFWADRPAAAASESEAERSARVAADLERMARAA